MARAAVPGVIADAGPLIALAKIKRLGLLKRLFGSVEVTAVVTGELRLGTLAPGAAELGNAFDAGWLLRLAPPKVKVPEHRILDAGEASCLAAATAAPGALLLIDERLGRSEAQRLGIAYMGTAGVLCAAKDLDYLRAIRPALNELLAAGYFLSDSVIEDACRRAGQ